MKRLLPQLSYFVGIFLLLVGLDAFVSSARGSLGWLSGSFMVFVGVLIIVDSRIALHSKAVDTKD